MNLCNCGCGTPIKEKSYGRNLRYVHGHNWRGKSRGGMSDEEKLGATKKCACGCGQKITEYRLKKDGRRYKVRYAIGHNRRGKSVYWFWKGGKTEEARRIKQSGEYRAWRKAVFERDNYTCQICGIRGGVELHPDHIKAQSQFPELRFELSNGRTLCINCHRKTDNYGLKAWRSP